MSKINHVASFDVDLCNIKKHNFWKNKTALRCTAASYPALTTVSWGVTWDRQHSRGSLPGTCNVSCRSVSLAGSIPRKSRRSLAITRFVFILSCRRCALSHTSPFPPTHSTAIPCSSSYMPFLYSSMASSLWPARKVSYLSLSWNNLLILFHAVHFTILSVPNTSYCMVQQPDIQHYSALHDRTTNKLERLWQNAAMSWGTILKFSWSKENHRNFSYNSQCSIKDTNWAPSEQKYTELPPHQPARYQYA